MEDITAQTLVSGHPWPELREMIHEQVQKARPQVYAVYVHLSFPGKSVSFKPQRVREESTRLFEEIS